jgi:hypothetical protein
MVIRAFSRGADGVMILGCHPGDCHYATGNYYARNRAQVLAQLFQKAGLDAGRFMLDWVSAGEGERFASLVSGFTDQIRHLGLLGSELASAAEKEELPLRLDAATRVVGGERVRWLMGRKQELLEKGDVYGRPIHAEAFDDLLQASVSDEYLRNRLLLLTAERPLSVVELAGAVGMPPRQVLPHVMALEQRGLMAMVAIEGHTPTYQGI